jgi:hypothetical protein
LLVEIAVLRKIFSSDSNTQDMFGLKLGEAVDLLEWLTPIPVLKELGEEAGLELGECLSSIHHRIPLI